MNRRAIGIMMMTALVVASVAHVGAHNTGMRSYSLSSRTREHGIRRHRRRAASRPRPHARYTERICDLKTDRAAILASRSQLEALSRLVQSRS